MFAQFRSTSYNHIPTIWKESLSFSLQGPHRYNFGSCEIESPKKERKYQGLVCLNPLLEAVQFGTENWSEKTKNKSFKSKNETSILIETRLYLESILYRKTESTDTFWARGFSWINNNSMVGLNSDLYCLCGSLHGLHTFWARGLSWINQETTTTTITTGSWTGFHGGLRSKPSILGNSRPGPDGRRRLTLIRATPQAEIDIICAQLCSLARAIFPSLALSWSDCSLSLIFVDNSPNLHNRDFFPDC